MHTPEWLQRLLHCLAMFFYASHLTVNRRNTKVAILFHKLLACVPQPLQFKEHGKVVSVHNSEYKYLGI